MRNKVDTPNYEDPVQSIFTLMSNSVNGHIGVKDFQLANPNTGQFTLNERESQYARWFFANHADKVPSIFMDSYYSNSFCGPVINQVEPELLQYYPPDWVQLTASNPAAWYDTPPYQEFQNANFDKTTFGQIMIVTEHDNRIHLLPGFILAVYTAKFKEYTKKDSETYLGISGARPRIIRILPLSHFISYQKKLDAARKTGADVTTIRPQIWQISAATKAKDLMNTWFIPYYDSIFSDGMIDNSMSFGYLVRFMHLQYLKEVDVWRAAKRSQASETEESGGISGLAPVHGSIGLTADQATTAAHQTALQPADILTGTTQQSQQQTLGPQPQQQSPFISTISSLIQGVSGYLSGAPQAESSSEEENPNDPNQ